MNDTKNETEKNVTLDSFVSFMIEKRQAMGMTQTDLARKIKRPQDKTIDRAFINKIETGQKKGITIDTINRILTALNSSIGFKEF